MIAIKIWFTSILILLGSCVMLAPLGVVIAVVGLVFSLPAIPLLHLFWQTLKADPHPKWVIMLWSCLATVFISLLCVMLAMMSFGGVRMLSDLDSYFMLLTVLPAFASVISICINTEGIYRYVQKKHILHNPGSIRESIKEHLSNDPDAIK